MNEVARRETSSSPWASMRRDRSRVVATCSAVSVSSTTGRIAVRVASRESTTASAIPASASSPSAQRSVPSAESTSASGRATKMASSFGPRLTRTRIRSPWMSRSARNGARLPCATCCISRSSPSCGGPFSAVTDVPPANRVTRTSAGDSPLSSIVSAWATPPAPGPGSPRTVIEDGSGAIVAWVRSESSSRSRSVSRTTQ